MGGLRGGEALLISTFVVISMLSILHFKSSSPKSSHDAAIASLKEEVDELRSLLRRERGTLAVRDAREVVPPAFRMLGGNPGNRPSSVKRTPAPKEGRWGGPGQVYDGLTDAKHLGGSTDEDHAGRTPGMWVWLMKAVTVKSVVDVGCGRGISTRWFMDHGADVLCIEGANDAIEKSYLPRNKIVAHDFQLGPYWPDKTYDLAWCIEVLEHVKRPYMANYQAIFHKSAIIIASHSPWGGHHHVEVHPDYWWITRLEMQGFVYSERLTKIMRFIARETKAPGNGNAGTHLTNTAHVYINPKVASLPQHAHLMGRLGCYRGKGDERPCKDPSQNVPDEWLPILRSPTQWDMIQVPESILYQGTEYGLNQQRRILWDLSLTNDNTSKCRDDYPAPTVGDGCNNLGRPYN